MKPSNSRAKKRIEKEYKKFQRARLEYAVITPVEEKGSEEMKTRWDVQLLGPKNSPYEKGKFHMEIEFPITYPMKAPEITFKTKIYHPQIETKTGKLCPQILQQDG